MSFNYFESLSKEAAERYQRKLSLLGLDKCPYKYPADSWTEDPSQWPSLSYHNLYQYLIKTPCIYSPEAMENYKSLEAWRFFQEGWVQTVVHMKISQDIMILKCDVRPSYRTTSPNHKPWIALGLLGNVVTAHCNCMAGLGETCSHVAATLYKVEAAVRIGMTSSTPTDLPCQWNQTFVKNIVGSPVSQINLYSDAAKEKLTGKRTRKMPVSPTNIEKYQFLSELKSVQPKTAALSLFKDFDTEFIHLESTVVAKLPLSLRNFFNANYKSLDNEQLNSFFDEKIKDLKLNSDDIVYVKEATRNQSLCDSWYQVRVGRITGSTLYQVFHARVETPPKSLILNICSEKNITIKSPPIVWGRENEENALTLYTQLYSDCNEAHNLLALSDIVIHQNLKVEKLGLCIDYEKPWYAASPDASVYCTCCGHGVLEIKCPFSLKDKSLKEEILKDVFYVGLNTDGKYFLQKQHTYFFQVQLEMRVTGVSYCDFMVWTPSEFIVLRIEPDISFMESVFNKCDVFWNRFILRELVTREVESGMKLPSSTLTETINNDDNVFCICKSKSSENDDTMVGCDSCDNWFHLKCISLKSVPRSSVWYCNSCKNKKKSAHKNKPIH
ncbi:uncharacterized protein LOC124817620 isoform X2 [Hydra vulgaris]|uniref:uncharacterized protein LOC124817620 isoform X2 n=1 Tax=Hydra vulgaris TaxID=6087 RepID=UPI001F5F366A|nr:uncharacterized protein LOC124817620 [Hydra vulgaris]